MKPLKSKPGRQKLNLKGRDKKCPKNIPKPRVSHQDPPTNPIATPSEPAIHPPLTLKQKMFVKEYLIDFNATRAAKAAGYSEKTAHQAGKENIHKPTIKAAISAAIEERSKRIDVTIDRITQELALVAFARMGEFVRIDDSGIVQAIPIEELGVKDSVIRKVKDKRVIRTTKGTENSPDGEQILDATFEFELHDKLKALEMLGKYKGMFIEKQEIDLKQPLEVTVRQFFKTKPTTEGSSDGVQSSS